MSGTQTATGGGTKLLLALVVVLAGIGFVRATSSNRDRQKKVKFSVTFEPAARVIPVVVTLTIDGTPVVAALPVRQSPWVTTLNVGSGAKATLTAVQESPRDHPVAVTPGKLSCAVNDIVQETTDQPGPVVCIYVRTQY